MSASFLPRRRALLPSLVVICGTLLTACNLPIMSSQGQGAPTSLGPLATSQQGLHSSGQKGSTSSYHGCGKSAKTPDAYYLCVNHNVVLAPIPGLPSGSYTISAGNACTKLFVGPQTVVIQDKANIPGRVTGQFKGHDAETDMEGQISLSLGGGGSCNNGVIHVLVRQQWTNGHANLSFKCFVKNCNFPPVTNINIGGPANTNFTMDIPLLKVFSPGGVDKVFPMQTGGEFDFTFITSDLTMPLVPIP